MKLPLNCEAEYLDAFIDSKVADELFAELKQLIQTITYHPQTVDGHSYEVNFKKLMFLDQILLEEDKFPEQIWGPTRLWTANLQQLKANIESYIGQVFHVCVLIYYPDGNSGVDFHSDYVAFGDTTTIPSISLGEEREFILKEKSSGNEFTKRLAHGSLIIMGEHCQDRYEHSLPISPEYKNPRINLTFRKYGFSQ